MTRAIAIISCLVAALFLVPVQGDCGEISEYESETEIECCAVVSSVFHSKITEELPKISLPYESKIHHDYVSAKATELIYRLPTRILHCVFRE